MKIISKRARVANLPTIPIVMREIPSLDDLYLNHDSLEELGRQLYDAINQHANEAFGAAPEPITLDKARNFTYESWKNLDIGKPGDGLMRIDGVDVVCGEGVKVTWQGSESNGVYTVTVSK